MASYDVEFVGAGFEVENLEEGSIFLVNDSISIASCGLDVSYFSTNEELFAGISAKVFVHHLDATAFGGCQYVFAIDGHALPNTKVTSGAGGFDIVFAERHQTFALDLERGNEVTGFAFVAVGSVYGQDTLLYAHVVILEVGAARQRCAEALVTQTIGLKLVYINILDV